MTNFQVYVLVAGLLLAGFASGGVYEIAGAGTKTSIVINRFTGTAFTCITVTDSAFRREDLICPAGVKIGDEQTMSRSSHVTENDVGRMIYAWVAAGVGGFQGAALLRMPRIVAAA